MRIGNLVPGHFVPGIDGWDLLAGGGLASIFYGLWCIWPPVAYIVVGALVIGLVVLRGLSGRAPDHGHTS